MYTTIITLYKQDVSQRQIEKMTKVNRKTIRKIIERYKQKGVEDPTQWPGTKDRGEKYYLD
jgi:transposase